MAAIEWWYDLKDGFYAPARLVGLSFQTRIGGHIAAVYPPSIPTTGDQTADWLAPPRIAGRQPERSSDEWGAIPIGTKAEPVSVAVRRFAFTADIPGHLDLRAVAQEIAAAMDEWWEVVSTWIEIVTGQHMTRVGHQEVLVLGIRTPVWPLLDDGTHGKLIPQSGVTPSQMGGRSLAVTPEVLSDCLALCERKAPIAWGFIRDARALKYANQDRRGVIDAATAAELAVTRLLDARLLADSPETREKLLAKSFGQKKQELERRGYTMSPSVYQDLVLKRAAAVHEGKTISRADCNAAIEAAISLVEAAFPLPVPPGSSEPLQRQWSDIGTDVPGPTVIFGMFERKGTL